MRCVHVCVCVHTCSIVFTAGLGVEAGWQREVVTEDNHFFLFICFLYIVS